MRARESGLRENAAIVERLAARPSSSTAAPMGKASQAISFSCRARLLRPRYTFPACQAIRARKSRLLARNPVRQVTRAAFHAIGNSGFRPIFHSNAFPSSTRLPTGCLSLRLINRPHAIPLLQYFYASLSTGEIPDFNARGVAQLWKSGEWSRHVAPTMNNN